MTQEEILKIKLNYFELAYIQNIEQEQAKKIFEEVTSRKIIADYSTEIVLTLSVKFGNIKSLDKRYDGLNSLVFNLMIRSNDYKKYLSDEQFILSGRFTGGKSVLLKIMSKEQLRHLYSVRKQKYNDILELGKYKQLIIE